MRKERNGLKSRENFLNVSLQYFWIDGNIKFLWKMFFWSGTIFLEESAQLIKWCFAPLQAFQISSNQKKKFIKLKISFYNKYFSQIEPRWKKLICKNPIFPTFCYKIKWKRFCFSDLKMRENEVVSFLPSHEMMSRLIMEKSSNTLFSRWDWTIRKPHFSLWNFANFRTFYVMFLQC